MDLSGRGSSEGEYITYTVNERLDVRSMLRWARNRPGIDPNKVVVFGTSNGGASAIYAAAEDDALPALVLDATYGDLWEAAGEMLRSRGGHPVLRYPLSVAVRLRAGVNIASVRPFDVIPQVKAKVLFVHGDADRQVPVTHSEKMHEDRLSAGLPSEIWILPGGEHGFDNYPPEGIFWNRILDFLDRALGAAAAAWISEYEPQGFSDDGRPAQAPHRAQYQEAQPALRAARGAHGGRGQAAGDRDS